MKTLPSISLIACLAAGAENWIPLFNGKDSEGGGDTSSSPQFSGLDWVTVEAEVRGGEEIIHRVNGKEVLRYQNTRLDDGMPLASGYIAIQAESHNTEFRKILIRKL